VIPRDLALALLLPLPPLLGFWVFRLKGRVGLSYGYFLGGTLAVLAMPWPLITGKAQPMADLGGALLGFSLYLQAHREGRQGIRRMVVGLGGATLFAWAIGAATGLSMASLARFWGIGLLVALVWLGLSDLGYRWARGKYLQARLPLVGGLTLLLVSLLPRVLPFGSAAISWSASLLAGTLLGLVALQQLLWLRGQGLWVEGRGDGFRIALSALESNLPPEGVHLSYRIEAQQPILLLDDRGLILEGNEAFARLVGVQRHQLRGFDLQGMFQGRDRGVWESLRQQLLKRAHGSATATLVRPDSSFQEVLLETVAFDRNMALVWISDLSPGSLAVRTGAEGPFLYGGPGGRDRAANAIGALLAATETLIVSTEDGGTQAAARLARAAALRISSLHGHGRASGSAPILRAPAALEELRPRVVRVLPSPKALEIAADDLDLQVDAELLDRIVLQLLLAALDRNGGPAVVLRLLSVMLGGRRWALLTATAKGPCRAGEATSLGLGWLNREVAEARGMLELAEGPRGVPQPRVFLPVAGDTAHLDPEPLKGRSVWIVEADPLLREAVAGLVEQQGGMARPFPDLRSFLRATRGGSLPDLAVLERSPGLARYQRALHGVPREAMPVLLLGNGDPLPASVLGPGLPRMGFLEKPFLGQEFIQSLLALLNSGGRAG